MKLKKLKDYRSNTKKMTQEDMANAIQQYVRDINHNDTFTYKRTSYNVLENGNLKTVPSYLIDALSSILELPKETIIEFIEESKGEPDREEALRELQYLLNQLDTEKIHMILNIVRSIN